MGFFLSCQEVPSFLIFNLFKWQTTMFMNKLYPNSINEELTNNIRNVATVHNTTARSIYQPIQKSYNSMYYLWQVFFLLSRISIPHLKSKLHCHALKV